MRPEPEVEGDIGVARDAREIVVVCLAAFHLAALGLHGDDRLAAADCSEMKSAVANLRVVLGRAPGIPQIVLQDLRQRAQRGTIIRDAPRQSLRAERVPQRLHRGDIEAGGAEIAKQSLR